MTKGAYRPPPRGKVVAVRKTQGPPAEEWEKHRAEIARLYRDEKKPLKEVVETMRLRFDFDAKERMYKTRIRAWGLDRNRKAVEMHFAYCKAEQRRKRGKATEIWIRGKIVPEQDVLIYYKRRPRPTTVEMLQDYPTPPELDYATPTPLTPVPLTSTVQKNIVDEDEQTEEGLSRTPNGFNLDAVLSFAAMEAFTDEPLILPPLTSPAPNQAALRSLHRYFGSLFFDSDHWRPWANLPLSRVHRRRGYPSAPIADDPYDTYDKPGQLVGNIEVAIRLFEARRGVVAGKLLDMAFSSLHSLLNQQHPQFMTSILLLIQLLQKKNMPDLLAMLLGQLYNMSEIILGPKHPLTEAISALGQSASEELLEPAYEYILSIFNTRAGALHAQHLEAKYVYAWSLLQKGRRGEAWEALSKLLEIYHPCIESTDMRLRQVLYSLAQIAISNGDLAGADRILADVQDRIEHRFGANAVVEMKVECLRLRGVLRKESSPGGQDRDMLLDAACLGSQILSADHPVMLLLQQDLQS